MVQIWKICTNYAWNIKSFLRKDQVSFSLLTLGLKMAKIALTLAIFHKTLSQNTLIFSYALPEQMRPRGWNSPCKTKTNGFRDEILLRKHIFPPLFRKWTLPSDRNTTEWQNFDVFTYVKPNKRRKSPVITFQNI